MSTDKKLQQASSSNLELWGGIECTINRINDTYLDQLEYANHYTRETDPSLIAGLGIKTLRYPILWERHQPNPYTEIDWSWTEKQLAILINKGIKPIAGLVHHGSGPAFTNLLDENFAEGLANYAEKVATKFPWIEYYTPVNEPLTTARFSGLYGFWYPHAKNDVSFAKMLLNQMKGVVLAMKAIRRINPSAMLVQTEDLGKTYCSPSLQYQANFENERRWLTYDLLCGNVKPGHKMWNYFLRLGIPETSLNFFLENPCPPAIMGFNHYITSERFIDEDYKKYPSFTHGGNELQVYADVEACRVPHSQPSGLRVLLKEAWQKFKLPIAITEVQLNCGREDQARWLTEVWDICLSLRNEGLDIRAVTAWALFGSYGWNKLLTSKKMDYEPGAFDVGSGFPRATVLTSVIKALVSQQKYSHPLIEHKGWWQRDIRFVYEKSFKTTTALPDHDNSQPVLIIGKHGTLGKAFGKICGIRSINFKLLGRQELDITNELQIEEAINKYNPWAIINAAGFVRVDDAETEIEKCFNDNSRAVNLLAGACKKYGIQFMTFSSDLVFDGTKQHPYVEGDKINPLNIYGRSKAEAESVVLNINPNTLVIRTSAFFGPWDEYNFVSNVINTLSANNNFAAASDIFISPTYVPDLVNVSLDLLVDNEKGIWHLANNGEITWANLARKVSDKAGLDTDLVEGQPIHLLNWKALRPKYSVLKSEKGILLPTLDNALMRYFEERSISIEPATISIK
ncbi:MAG: sugar nucleotide-binding protein [Chitinophagaceae bacterium]|nr:sugar nucleotide-binding protein [Chitinophagaceae bacterium]